MTSVCCLTPICHRKQNFTACIYILWYVVENYPAIDAKVTTPRALSVLHFRSCGSFEFMLRWQADTFEHGSTSCVSGLDTFCLHTTDNAN